MTKRLKLYLLAAALMLLASCSKEIESVTAPQSKPQWAEGELLVKFSPELSDILDAISGPATRSGIPAMDEVLSTLGSCSLERVFPIDPRNEDRSRTYGFHLWYIVKFQEDTDLDKAMERLGRLGEIATVQCNRLIYRSPRVKPVFIPSSSLSNTTKVGSSRFNDPELYRQWHYINDGSLDFGREWAPVLAGSDCGLESAWEKCQGDPSIIVAVLDEGVMYSHPDLAANMWVNGAEVFGSELDADGNGYAGDRYGYNFTSDSGKISYSGANDSGHGTHVAGTIAAVNNNGIGCCGIAGGNGLPGSGVKIMSCQIFDNALTCTVAAEARAMKYAADNGAVILQCSWGYNSAMSNPLQGFTPGPGSEKEWASLYPLEKEAIDYFIHNAGSPNGVIDGGLVIYASGNEFSGMSAFPAAYSECISVAAIAADYTPSSYSNYGSEVELCAPGGDIEYYCTPGIDEEHSKGVQGSIFSTLVLDGIPGYGYYDGTSMACPHVAGVAALGLSYAAKLHRHFTAREFRSLLVESAREIDSYFTGEKLYYYNHTSAGASPTRMNLAQYRGKMGRLVDAVALLSAIEDGGHAMRLPNFCLAPRTSESIDLACCFEGGEKLSFSAEIADTSIVQAALYGSILKISALKEGTTTLIVKASDGQIARAGIIVRAGSGDGGWL